MKKLLLIILLCVSFCTSFSQYYLGLTEQEVLIKAYRDSGLKIRKQYDNGSLQIVWDHPQINTVCIAVFKDNYVSDFFIVPNDAITAKEWLNVVQRDYEKIAPDTWRAYIEGVGVDIYLDKSYESGVFYFRYNYAK